MAAPKSERLLNLLIMLLVTRHYAPKQQIREALYPDAGDEAFEKMFERDKEELRSLGVPIEVGHLDKYFEDEPGYRVRPDRFALPEVSLSAEEAAVVGLATRVWEHARLAEATSDAVRKLAASGLDPDPAALDLVEPRLRADEPGFEVFWEAALHRFPIRFDYRRAAGPQRRTRHLQPWGVVRYAGRWYAVGYDTDRAGERVFRLSRVLGSPQPDGPPGSFTVPAGTDVRAIAQRLVPAASPVPTTVLVRTGTCHALRRYADRSKSGVRGPDGSTGWDRLLLPHAEAGDLLSHGADLVVESPVELRETVVARLRALAAR